MGRGKSPSHLPSLSEEDLNYAQSLGLPRRGSRGSRLLVAADGGFGRGDSPGNLGKSDRRVQKVHISSIYLLRTLGADLVAGIYCPHYHSTLWYGVQVVCTEYSVRITVPYLHSLEAPAASRPPMTDVGKGFAFGLSFRLCPSTDRQLRPIARLIARPIDMANCVPKYNEFASSYFNCARTSNAVSICVACKLCTL